MTHSKYILIKNKNNTQENLWKIIGKSGDTYIIQSRETVRYINQKDIIISNGNIFIGTCLIDVNNVDFDVCGKEKREDKCQSCLYRCSEIYTKTDCEYYCDINIINYMENELQ